MDSSVKFVPLLIGLLLAVIMVGAVFVPVVQSSTTQTITTTTENEGAEWLKLGYNEGEDYSFTVGFDGEDNFSVGTQTGEYENLICYADNERTLFVSGDYWYLLTTGETPSVYQFTDTASVTNASGTLTILDGSETVYTGASPTWAYVPDANGVYGFFTEGGLNLEEGKPTVAVGSYAGVFAYNDTVVAPNGYGDLGLTMSGNYADEEVIWAVVPSELDTLSALPTDTLEPAVLDLEPISIQPIDLGGSGSVSLMSVSPSGDYVDGDYTFGSSSQWGWCVYTYTGTDATEINIPTSANINGTIRAIPNIGNFGYQVLTDSALSDSGATLIINNGTTRIQQSAFWNVSKFVGDLIIPDSVVAIGNTAFSNCSGFDGILKLPDNAGVNFAPQMFSGCSGFKGTLVIPKNLTYFGAGAFNNCSGFDSLIYLTSRLPEESSITPALNMAGVKEVLNLGGAELTTTTAGLNADSVQDHVTALGYIAPTSIHETEVVPIDSPVAGLMQMLPLIAGVGALLLAVATMIYTRF